MGRYQKEVYCFITDENNKYCRAKQDLAGNYSLSRNSQPYPIEYNPINLLDTKVQFATNKKVFGLMRSIIEPLEFIKDGAAILRSLYFLGKGAEQEAYITIVSWNGVKNLYELSYKGKFDFSEKIENPDIASFTCPLIDDTAWGLVSRRQDVNYAYNCNSRDSKAVKVLIDGVTLLNKYTFQTVPTPITSRLNFPAATIPFVLVNQDGDSVGIVIKNQTFIQYNGANYPAPYYNTPPDGTFFLKTIYPLQGVNIQGSFKFKWYRDHEFFPLTFVKIFFQTSFGQRFYIFNQTTMITNNVYTVNFNITLNLQQDEAIFFCKQDSIQYTANPTITPITSNIIVTTKTVTEPRVVFAKRPLDLLKDIVKSATNSRYSIESRYFTKNNKSVILSGDAIRGVQDAKLFTSFDNYFTSFDALNFMALRNVKGVLQMEKAVNIYKTTKSVSSKYTIIVSEFFSQPTLVIYPIIGLDFVVNDELEISFNNGQYNEKFVITKVTPVYSTSIELYTNNTNNYPPKAYYPNTTIKLNGEEVGSTETTRDLIDLGDCETLKLSPAKEYFANEIETGSPKQDLRRPSGRLEFNSVNSWALPSKNSNVKLTRVTDYKTGCYEIIFLLLDYQGGSTQDNSGDKSNYILDITDDVGTASEDVQTFETITIDNSLLEPIITSPFTNDVITNTNPSLRGISQPNKNINIYRDGILDGNTTSDINGNWIYNVVTALQSFVVNGYTGIHSIKASYTDLSAPFTEIVITINTFAIIDTQFIYPTNQDSLYNNTPLIKGVAQPNSVFTVFLNSISIGNVTVDSSGYWQLRSPVMQNGTNTLSIASLFISFEVDSFTVYPLITYIDRDLDQFPIVNNLPLVKGVGIPNTVVQLFLNYISYTTIGQAVVNLTGNWQIQVTPTSYLDPITVQPVNIAPVRNGNNIFSTSLQNHLVKINVTGYKLNRPAFSSITGVTDTSVFNTAFSPKRMLINYYPMLSAMFSKQQLDNILFQKAGQNSALTTTLNGVTIIEAADVAVSSLGKPIAILENVEIKTIALQSFAKVFENFSNGGVVKFSYKGTDMYALPIGQMTMDNIRSNTQNWKLLLAPINSYSSLLNLYKNGLIIKLMQNSMFHSDLNTLHMVEYNFQENPRYNFKGLYQDWFENRNSAWVLNPSYLQKLQRNDLLKDQIIANGIGTASLKMYRCLDATLIDTFQYNPVVPQILNPPDVVLEVVIDLTQYAEDQYFFVLCVGELNVSISERIETKDKWNGTILIESSNTLNKVGFFYSTGIKTLLRVEGIVKKLQPLVNSIGATSESGNRELLYSLSSKKREIRFGTAYGLPDYLYLKVADALIQDTLSIEGVYYTIQEDEKIQSANEVDGHPLYYYNVNLVLSLNQSGAVFGGGAGAIQGGVTLVLDGEAVGLPAGSLLNIEVDTP